MLSTEDDKGSILLDVFQQYKLPLHISQDYIDPVDGHVHRFQNRCLGVSGIKSGSQVFPQATFYEITESEISEISSTKLSSPSSSSSPSSHQLPHQEMSSPEEDAHVQQPESPPSNSMIKGLPPKKRKRRRMIRYEIIFTIDKGPIHLSPEHTFYALPRDAVTESLTDSVPHKLLFSFFSPSTCGISQNHSQCGCHSYHPPTTALSNFLEESNDAGTFKTKLEEFAAVCSTSCKLALPSVAVVGDQQQPVNKGSNIEGVGHVNNIVLSNVSHELYRAIKQMVSAYEIMCQSTMELMKLHSEKVIHHKSEIDFLPETAISLPNQSDDDYQASKNDEWSSSDEHSTWDKVSRDDEEETFTEIIPTQSNKIHTVAAATTTVTVNNSKNMNKSSATTHGGSRGGNNNNSSSTSNQIKKCLYCGSKSTPMWRRGPQGAGTLCNACGVKWKHGKILNGSDAPTTDNTIVAGPPLPSSNNRRGSGNNKSEKKRKRSNASNTSTNSNKRASTSKKRTTSVSSNNGAENGAFYDTFAVPALPPQPPQQQTQHWEGTSASSSSTSDSRSPLESFSSSPNTSPSITTLMEQQHDIKRDISNLMAYDTETLSVYVGEDAVEAAAVLTLLKRS